MSIQDSMGEQRNLDALGSLAFLAALGILLLNDFVLKPALHNGATGKISDFAGLFAFAVFWAALYTRRRLIVVLAAGVGFVFWKSPYSEPMIDAWNSLGGLQVGRTVDYTDCIALAVLVPAYAYVPRAKAIITKRLTLAAVVPLSLFAFAATSARTTIRYDVRFDFPFSESELRDRMSRLGLELRPHSPIGILPPEEIAIEMRNASACRRVTANVRLEGRDESSAIHLVAMDYPCPRRPRHRDDLLELFEDSVVRRLRPRR